MTTQTISSLSLALGANLAHLSGRALLAGLAHIARAPMASAATGFVLTFSVIASANALYGQPGKHPAPFFAPAAQTAPAIVPADRIDRSMQVSGIARQMPVRALEAPARAVADPAPVKVGNKDVAEIQKLLAEMGLFDGKVDGYYGPVTAAAIRAFEMRAGLKPMGAVSLEVLDALRRGLPEGARGEIARDPAPQTLVVPAASTVQATGLAPLSAPVEQPAAPVREPVAIVDPIAEIARRVAAEAVATVSAEPEPTPAPVQQAAARPAPLASIAPASAPALDPAQNRPELVSRIQRGLASLGFLQGKADGVAGETTARAIRNFEVYFNYDVTGQATPELLDLLVEAGAVI